MAAHAKLSASGSHRWLVCSKAPEMEAGAADSGSEAAAEGTAAHEIAKRCLQQNVDADTFAGLSVEVEKKTGDEWIPKLDGPSDRDPECLIWTFEVDREMVVAVQRFVDTVRDRGPDELLVEQRLDYSLYVPDGFGTGDAVSIVNATKTLYVDDLKYGKGVRVDAENEPDSDLYERGHMWNPQGGLYALGAYLEFCFEYEIENVVIGIHQPRLDHITEIEVSVSDLIAWAEGPVADAAAETLDGVFRPGEKQCQFCKKKRECRARAAWMLEAMTDDYVPVAKPDDLTDLFDLVEPLGDAPDALTHDELGALLPRLKSITKWAADVREYALERLMAGDTIPGWKPVAGNGSRSWTDEAKAEGAIKREVGAKNAFKTMLLTPPQVEDILGAKHRLLSAKFVTKTPGKPTLAPASDKKPSLIETVFDEFEELESADA